MAKIWRGLFLQKGEETALIEPSMKLTGHGDQIDDHSDV